MNRQPLPHGWFTGRLADVIEPRGEKVSPSAFPHCKFIGMDHVESQTTKIIGFVPASEMKSSAARFFAGDVLYGRLRPYLNKVTQPTFDGLASAEFIVFPDTKLIRSSFLKYRLNAADFVGFASHINEGDRPRVSFDQIGEFVILVPPPTEQDRIVAKIEELFSELDNGVENLKTAREQWQVYRQAVLKQAFDGKLTAAWREDRVNGDELNWSNAVLGDLLDLVTSGSRGWAKYYSSKGDVFIRAQNLKYDRLDLDDVAFVQIPEKSEGTRTRVQVGDVLITITGANVTKTAFIKEDIGTAYVSQHVALARPTEALLSEFLHWFLVSEAAGRKQLNASAYGAGKPGLNLDNIKSVVISLPTKLEQMEIINRLNSILSVIQNCEAGIDVELKRSDALRQSILKKAFSGNLVSQDPNDEPTSILLERIRGERAEKENGKKKIRRKYAA
jgi:type I restriction enzyme, S subunit